MRTYKIFYLLIIILIIAGCQSNNNDGNTYKDNATGKTFTQGEWDNLEQEERERIIEGNTKTTEGDSFMDKILSAKVVFLYAVGALLCVVGGLICMMRKPAPNIIGAISCAAAAALCAVLPALIAIFWTGGIIILWILGGFLIVCAAIAAYFFWLKMKNKFEASEKTVEEKHQANVGLVKSVDHILNKVDDKVEQEIRKTLKDDIQCNVTKKTVREIQGKTP